MKSIAPTPLLTVVAMWMTVVAMWMTVVAKSWMTVVAMTWLAGCSTIPSRIEERPAAFAALPPQVQQRVREGKIAVGDNKDAVYIALGKPDRVRTVTDSTGLVRDTWYYTGVYYTSYTVWPGAYFYSYSRRRRSDHPFGHHYHGPDTIDVREEYVRLRIEFEKDHVKLIEQTER